MQKSHEKKSHYMGKPTNLMHQSLCSSSSSSSRCCLGCFSGEMSTSHPQKSDTNQSSWLNSRQISHHKYGISVLRCRRHPCKMYPFGRNKERWLYSQALCGANRIGTWFTQTFYNQSNHYVKTQESRSSWLVFISCSVLPSEVQHHLEF